MAHNSPQVLQSWVDHVDVASGAVPLAANMCEMCRTWVTDYSKLCNISSADDPNIIPENDMSRTAPVTHVQVVRLHNLLAAAANTEAHQIATHADLWRTVYACGANEKYIPFLQTMPAFTELPAEAAAEAEGNAYDAAVEEATRLLDASEIAEFKRNLSWALGEVRSLVSSLSWG